LGGWEGEGVTRLEGGGREVLDLFEVPWLLDPKSKIVLKMFLNAMKHMI
jgi:hypothetical protein